MRGLGVTEGSRSSKQERNASRCRDTCRLQPDTLFLCCSSFDELLLRAKFSAKVLSDFNHLQSVSHMFAHLSINLFIHSSIHLPVRLSINVWWSGTASKLIQSVDSWGFLFQKRSHNLEKKKQEAQHVSCWTVRKTDRANKHSSLQTHPHAGTTSVLTFSTSVLHHLVLMCQSDRWSRTPPPFLQCDL